MKKSIIIYFLITAFNINAQHIYDQFKERESDVNKNIKEEVVKIKKNYYMIKPIDAVAGNIGVFVAKDGLVLVDDQWEVTKKHVMKALRKISNKDIKYIINTHFHYDHVDGNKAFSKLKIPVISHKNVRKRLSDDATLSSGFIQPKHPKEALPSITFEKALELDLKGELIEIFHNGSGHTDGDAIIHFKNADIFHTGDLFVTYGFPFIDFANGGSVKGFINTLDRIIELSNEDSIIIPGHGDLCHKRDVESLRDKLQHCIDEVAKGKKLGKTVDELIEEIHVDLKGGFKEAFFKEVYNRS
ncbi:MAG: MBL fold metallo-hydrolase [Candidatus Marinimicrobia bacterium]|jgi:glyoxylase-like metal-dependent hydrolase (beta-lactamase superfamily II)|nr:MBL fold metallo-hydrolase [Candidatus Neomarinimicrobiota bacterium]